MANLKKGNWNFSKLANTGRRLNLPQNRRQLCIIKKQTSNFVLLKIFFYLYKILENDDFMFGEIKLQSYSYTVLYTNWSLDNSKNTATLHFEKQKASCNLLKTT